MTAVHSPEAEHGAHATGRGDGTPLAGGGTGPGPVPGESRRRRFLLHVGAFGWFLLVAVYATWPLAAEAGTHVMGNLGDPLEIVWRLAWGAHAIVEQPLHLFDANMFHPEPLTLAYSENHLGVALPVAPIFWLTGNALLAYNVEVLLVLAAAGFGVYLLTFEVTGCRTAALVAGTAYTAVPFRVSMAALGHVHVLALHLAPLVLVALLRLRGNRSWRPVAAVAVLIGLAWWSSFSGAFMTMALVGVWGVWEAAHRRREACPVLGRAAVGAAAGLLLALPVLWPYFEVRRQHPDYRHAPSELSTLSATAGSYLHPPPGGPVVRSVYRNLARRFRPAEAAGEKELFPGFFLLGAGTATVGAAALSWGRRRRRAEHGPLPAAGTAGFLAALGAVAVILSFGPHYGARADGIPMPFGALDALVPGGLMRAPARVGALALLALASVVGIGLSWARPPWRRILVAASLMFIGVEAMPHHVTLVKPQPRTAAHRAIASQDGAVLGLPTLEFDAGGQVIPASLPRESQHLYLSTEHFRPLTNGWGAYHPPGALRFAAAVADLPSAGAFAALRERDVRTVVVQTGLTPGTPWAGAEKRLAGWSGVRRLARGEGVEVFDVSAAAP